MTSLETREHRIVSSCREDTLRLGALLGEHIGDGSVVALSGELGSGKTCLTQGIAQGLRIPRSFCVTSPSYTFINEYAGRLRLWHVDLYRVQSDTELEDLGLREFIGRNGVAVIEWAEKLAAELPDERLSVSIFILNEETRELRLIGYGRNAAELVDKCARKFHGQE